MGFELIWGSTYINCRIKPYIISTSSTWNKIRKFSGSPSWPKYISKTLWVFVRENGNSQNYEYHWTNRILDNPQNFTPTLTPINLCLNIAWDVANTIKLQESPIPGPLQWRHQPHLRLSRLPSHPAQHETPSGSINGIMNHAYFEVFPKEILVASNK